jgi:hypothetical protein
MLDIANQLFKLVNYAPDILRQDVNPITLSLNKY